MASSSRVILVTSDNKRFSIEHVIAEKSVVIRNILCEMNGDLEDDEYNNPEDDDSQEIPLGEVNAQTLTAVLRWCDHHKNSRLPEYKDNEEIIGVSLDKWDKQFLESLDQKILYDIVLAADYLNIKPLLISGCKVLALQMKSRTPDQIRQLFNIKRDLTPKDEYQIQKENEWAF